MPKMTKKNNAEFKLPPIEIEPPNMSEWSEEYGEFPFDPIKDGFSNEFELLGFLPYRKSIDIPESPIGIGYECLDHRKAYDFAKTIPIMKNSGVKWARVQTGWSRVETEKGVYNFAWLDEIVDGLLAIGIQPWLSVSYGNLLYMDIENPKPSMAYAPLLFGNDAIQGWRNYCAALAKHYKGRVSRWEVWNEPNAGFWGMPSDPMPANPNPVEYVELVKVTAKEIRKHQPDAKIVGGAISGGGCCNKYIKGLVENNIADYIDIFSYHPYGPMPEFYIEDRLKYIRSLFADCGKTIKLWQGECGRPSRTKVEGRGDKLTTANQARYLTRRILTDLCLGFDMTSYFCAGDLGNDYQPGGVHGQGVIDTTGKEYHPKPAFFALQSMTYLFDSKTKCVNSNIEVNRGFRKLNSIAEYNVITAGFLRGDIPIYSYYFPENIDIDYGVKRVKIHIWVEDWDKFKNPILIDPITRKVFKCKRKRTYKNEASGMYGFRSMPLLDYPLFITDLSLIQDKSSQ